MSFKSLINLQNCRITRKIDVILTKTQIIGGPVVDLQPPEASCLQIEISACSDGTGIIIVSGIVDEFADSETFDFSQNDILQSTKEFTFVSSISTVGFVDEATIGNIEIKTVTKTGQSIFQIQTIFSKMPCWVDVRRGGISILIPGGVVTSVTKLFCEHDSAHPLLENDIVHYDGRIYRIDSIEPCASMSKKIHHLELILKRAKIEES